MSLKDKLLNTLGLGPLDQELREYLDEIEAKKTPGMIVDIYPPNQARVRIVTRKFAPGDFLEHSTHITKYSNISGLIIREEGIYRSDGK